MQPGMMQPGMMQPGMMQPGMMQPHAAPQPFPPQGVGQPLPPLALPGGGFPPPQGDVPPSPDSKRFSDIARERGKVVAEQARDVAIQVAGHARSAAINVAKQSIGGEEPKKVIRIEDPSTWVKPMRGPLIALAAAVGISILAVIVGKATGTKLSVGWISGPLLLGAIVFAVIRWIRLQE